MEHGASRMASNGDQYSTDVLLCPAILVSISGRESARGFLLVLDGRGLR